MIDTGAAPNIIKTGNLLVDTKIDPEDTVLLSGITEEKLKTLGSVTANYMGHDIVFQVVRNDFPISQEGILGSDFLRNATKIDFARQEIKWQGIVIPLVPRETVTIPARSRTTLPLRVKDNGLTEGYVPRLKIAEDIFTGEAIVSSHDGRGYIGITNTSEKECKLAIPTVELQEIELISPIEPSGSISDPPVFCPSARGQDDKTTPNTLAALGSGESHQGLILNSTNISNFSEPRALNPPVFCSSARGQDEEPTSKTLATLGIGKSYQGSRQNSRSNERNFITDTRSPKQKNVKVSNPSEIQADDPPSGKITATSDEISTTDPRSFKQRIVRVPKPSKIQADNPPLRKLFITANDENSAKSQRASEIKPLLRLQHLNEEESDHVHTLVTRYGDIFRAPSDKLAYTNVVKHRVPTTDEMPIHTKQYRFPAIHKEEINKQIKDLLDNEVIQPSVSPYNSPLWIVPKKPDSKGNKRWRMVIDYRQLNEKTIGDAYPLPNIVEILDQLGSAKYFSVFDLASGFHQIPMHESDAPKTAFSTPHGHYEFNRMPFGLKNAPATFQRLMDQVLTGLQGNELFVYLDDIVIYARSLREHEIKFNKLADRLRKANLKLQPDKCEFLRREVTYLGHIISEDGVKPDPKKIRSVQDFPRPRNTKNIKQFLGLAGYYRRFIPNFSKTARPLTELLKKDTPFTWADTQEQAFSHLRDALISEPVLQYPDLTKPFVVTTDASDYAVGGILSQGTIGKDRPIAYTSRLLNAAERNYSTIEKELLAIVYSVNHFRSYLYGHKFTLVTDHKPLVWLHSVKDPTSRLVRWRLKLAEYNYEVIYKAGKTNVNADALSRNPVPTKIFPLSLSEESSDSLFHHPDPTHRRRQTTEKTNVNYDQDDADVGEQTLEELGTEIIFSDELPEDSDSDGEDESDNQLFDNINEPFEQNRNEPIEVRDNLITRKDNTAIFVTQQGHPCDEGARALQKNNKLPEIRNATLGRANVSKLGDKHLIALVIKDRVSSLTQTESLKEALHSLLDVSIELNLHSISMSKGDVDSIPWEHIRKYIRNVFSDSPTKIIICSNKIITPNERDRQGIIIENHSTAIGGHKGVTKTFERIRHNYFWPRMKRDIQTFIKGCRECQLKKLVRVKTRQPMILTDTPGAAFDKISMDIMGPLPQTEAGNIYILTIQDLLTKFSLAIPLKQATAIDIAEAFTNEFICTYGAPQAILTDQGANFISSLMRGIARKFRITQYRTSAYRPQSNGSIERSHHVLWEYLKQFTDKHHAWDEHLKLAMFSYNTSVHEGTRYTPHELVFGKIARAPASDPPITETEMNPSYCQYLTSLFNKIRDTQATARENLQQAKVRSKMYYDKRINVRIFNVRDKVYLLNEPAKGKLGDQYTGPHTILEKLPNHNVKISLSKNRSKIVHEDKLKIAKPHHIP